MGDFLRGLEREHFSAGLLGHHTPSPGVTVKD